MKPAKTFTLCARHLSILDPINCTWSHLRILALVHNDHFRTVLSVTVTKPLEFAELGSLALNLFTHLV